MKTRIIAVHALSDADEKLWQDLSERALEPNPLFEPSCVIPAARHQSFGDEIALVVVEEEDRFLACLPVRDIRRWKKVPYPMVTSQVRRMGYLGTPLVDASAPPGAMKALLEALRQHRTMGRGRILILDGVADDGSVAGLVRSAAAELRLPVRTWNSYERGILRRRADVDYGRLPGDEGRNLRRLSRRFADEFGTELTMTDRAADPAAIDDYIRLEAAGFKSTIGVAMATVPGEPEYFHEMCERFRAAGRLVVLTLQGDGQVLAIQIGMRGGEELFMIKSSFDEKFAHFKAGKQLHMRVMAYFQNDTDATLLDTCSDANNELLLKFYPDRRRITTFAIPLNRNLADVLLIDSMINARRYRRELRSYIERRRATAGPKGDEQRVNT
jgi:CelD/BcsL family acetyltransferase involved in cellulose biosynthesis